VRAEAGAAMAAHTRALRERAPGRVGRARAAAVAIADAIWHGVLARWGVRRALTTTSWRDHMRAIVSAATGLPALLFRDIGDDIRLAGRRLRHAPAFTLVAALTLALGIGANTAIFSVVNAVLLTPLPFPNADRLVAIFHVYEGSEDVVSPPNILDVAARTRTMQAVAGYNDRTMTLTGAGDPVRVVACEVSDGFFDVLSTPPLLGRTLVRADNTPGQADVAVLGYGLWQTRFGGRTDIVGQSITINDRTKRIVGVMPKAFAWPLTAELYVPAEYDNAYTSANRAAWILGAVGRMAPGVSLDAVRAELTGIASTLEREYPAANARVGLTARPLLDATVGDTSTALLVLLAAVGVVLLIACANVANLVLARSAARDQEFAIRAALGAGRRRLARQLIVESLVLAGLGAVAGVALAEAGIRALTALGPENIPRLASVSVNARVLWFAAAAATATGILFGLLPAAQASRTSAADALRERQRSAPGGARGRRVRAGLVAAELALAVLLLVGAGLLLKSFARLTQVDPGFDPANALTFSLSLPASYADDASRAAFYARVTGALAALPGVQGASAALAVPPVPMHFNLSFTVKGQPPPRPGYEPTLEVRMADDRYFDVLGVAVLKGRAFTSSDRAGAPGVVILTESAARKFFPAGDALGQIVQLGWKLDDGSLAGGEVVGIAADTRSHGLDVAPPAQVYLPVAQLPVSSMSFVVRTETAPGDYAAAVRQAVHDLDPKLPINRLETLEERVSRSIADRRFYMLLLATFAAVALLLAAIGIFGVLSYLVAQRTREIGIRMALGAPRATVIAMVLRQAMTPALAGIAMGLVAALALSHYMRSMLFDLAATDAATFASVAGLLTTVALVAAWWPARRATRVDASTALRD
jgi:predicted permease